ncbi:MAG TPA: dihydroorotase [Clostridia bacterium]|nr:dihydroorotase [Clostridia bacterium]
MKYILKNSFVFLDGRFSKNDVSIEGGVVSDISPYVSSTEGSLIYDLNNCYIFPGLLDAHVHLREPGFSYKETIKSGTEAAAKGGFTGVCAMPNLSPVPDSLSNLNIELELIKKDASVAVYPIGAITVSQDGKKLSDMEDMAPFVIGFSDDGNGVNDSELMLKAMRKAKKLNKPIIAHCEDLSYGGAGVINDCDYAKRHNLPAITSESEWRAIENDIKLLKKADCAYHVCHVSTKESVALIRDAKRQGLNITAETAPHYLFLNDTMLKDSGNFKMNPPIRGESDREALIEGLLDGSIDMIATDHAPHSEEEKSKGLLGSNMGVTGIELSFPLCYTNLVKTGILPLEKLLCLMHENPKNRFGIGISFEKGNTADLTVFDLSKNYKIEANSLISKGKSTPFLGENVFAKCVMTMWNGRIIWS